MNFGKTLKELRKQKNLTQNQFSEILGVHLQTVSKWERDIELPDLAILHLIASTLDVSIDTLLSVDCDDSARGSFSSTKMGDGIYRFRKSYGLTQAELGKKLGVSSDTISKWERGVILPKIDMLVTVANVFNVSPSFIYYGVVPKEERSNKKRNLFKWLISIASLFIVSIVLALSFILFSGENSPPSTNLTPNATTGDTTTGDATTNDTQPNDAPVVNTVPISPTTAFMNSIFPIKNGITISDEMEMKIKTSEGEKVFSATKGQLFWDGTSTSFYVQDDNGNKATYNGVKLKNGYVNGLKVEIGNELGMVIKNDQQAVFTFSLSQNDTKLKVSDYLSFTSNLVSLPIKNYTSHFCQKKGELYYNETLKGWFGFDGVAFFGNLRDEVISCFDGTVKQIIPASFLDGARVIVENNSGFIATYENVSPSVQVGQTVHTGQTLGTITEPQYRYYHLDSHLLFSLTLNGKSTYELDYILF